LTCHVSEMRKPKDKQEAAEETEICFLQSPRFVLLLKIPHRRQNIAC